MYLFARCTAVGTSYPCANDAAIELASVHPVPWVCLVSILALENVVVLPVFASYK
jgi:hypothetical protein